MKNWLAGIIGGIGIVSLVCGILLKVKGSMAMSIVGGADGPTSIFIAGKVTDDFFSLFTIFSVILAGLSIILFLARKK